MKAKPSPPTPRRRRRRAVAAVPAEVEEESPDPEPVQVARHFLNIVSLLVDFHSVSDPWVSFASSAGGAGEAEFCEVAG